MGKILIPRRSLLIAAPAIIAASRLGHAHPKHGNPLPDGYANAPAGTINAPTLLNGYAARAPWRVAAVDFYCGIPTGTSLSNPSTISDANITTNEGDSTTGNLVKIKGTPSAPIDSIDFSASGPQGNGWTLWNISGIGNSCTIQNCKFKQFTTSGFPIFCTNTAGNMTVKNCEFDGNSGAVPANSFWTSQGKPILVYLDGSGTQTFNYCYFHDAAFVFVGVSASIATAVLTPVFRYNYFNNISAFNGYSQNHADWFQSLTFGAGSSMNNSICDFNTFAQTDWTVNGGGSEGVFYTTGTGPMLNGSCSWNTIVVPAPSSIGSNPATATCTVVSGGGSGVTTLTVNAVPSGIKFNDGIRASGGGIVNGNSVVSWNVGGPTITFDTIQGSNTVGNGETLTIGHNNITVPIYINTSVVTNQFTVQYNYFDTTGVWTQFGNNGKDLLHGDVNSSIGWPGTGGTPTSKGTLKLLQANNINMVTGAAATFNVGTGSGPSSPSWWSG